MKNIIAISIVFLFTFSHTLAADVQTNVWRVQSSPSYSAPAGYEEKWFVGSIISQIFDPVGKILSEYVLAFQNILSSDGNVPRWNSTTWVFDVWSITDNWPSLWITVDGVVVWDSFEFPDGSTISGKFVDGTTNIADGVYTGTGNIWIWDISPSSKLSVYGWWDITWLSDLTANLMLFDNGWRMIMDSNEFQTVASDNTARSMAIQPFGWSVWIGWFPDTRYLLDVNGKAEVSDLNITSPYTWSWITGNNYRISGVDRIYINDPGEGIDFTPWARMYAIDDATNDKINIAASRIWVDTTTPTQKLDVNGKIRMRSQTSWSDTDDTVTTKKYVDDLRNAVVSYSNTCRTESHLETLVYSEWDSTSWRCWYADWTCLRNKCTWIGYDGSYWGIGYRNGWWMHLTDCYRWKNVTICDSDSR